MLDNPPADASPAPEAGPAALRVDRLSHAYFAPKRRRGQPADAGPRLALDHVSFDVAAGEIFAILGPNGSGKSTLFRILTTMLRPRAAAGSTSVGQASVFGHDVLAEPKAVRSLLGVVFQHPSLDGKLTAEENLRHQGRLYGLAGSELQRRIDDALQSFDVTGRRREPVERFSGGMRRRLELAKALLHEPRLVLMDEPSTGLDPGARRELWRQLEQLRARRGVTVVLTTHLMDEAERCDRLAIINAGRQVTVDTPARLKASIGGDVISIEPEPARDGNGEAAEQLAAAIAERFGPWADGAAPQVVGEQVRLEKPNGPEVVAAIASAWPGRIRRISVGQPTLEDVFVHLTGARL